MNRTSHRWAVASGAAVLAITLAACGGADAGSDTSSEGAPRSSASPWTLKRQQSFPAFEALRM